MAGTMVQSGLSQKERELVARIASLGPSVMFEMGMDTVAAHDFMSRKEVRAELERLNQEFNHQDVIQALTRFNAKRQLARLVPESVDVLRKALAGPTYVRGPDGKPKISLLDGDFAVEEPEPTATQMRAAAEVLDRVGVAGANKMERIPNLNLNVLFKGEEAASVAVEVEDQSLQTEEQRALSRERVRNFILMLSGRLKDIQSSDASAELVGVLKPKSKSKSKSKSKTAKAARGKARAKG